MGTKRRTFADKFKAEVVIEAIKGLKTLAERAGLQGKSQAGCPPDAAYYISLSVWMDGDESSTMCLWNGCGGRSNTKIFTPKTTPMATRFTAA